MTMIHTGCVMIFIKIKLYHVSGIPVISLEINDMTFQSMLRITLMQPETSTNCVN
uniref:Uncharacterized protein n=1 Tax=Anguilla anguilla TaxID=7936 RepID=A0A0E9WKW6_ANGAN